MSNQTQNENSVGKSYMTILVCFCLLAAAVVNVIF